MARKIKAKVSYKKNKKAPKAFVGAATAAMGLGKMAYGAVQASRARKAEKGFDKDRLKMGVSKATQQMADEPIDQGYIESMQQQQAADRASAMGALSKDPRNVLAGVQALEGQAAKQRTNLMGMQQDAKTKAMSNLASEQKLVEQQRLGVAGQEIAGIRGEKDAGVQNIFGGLEDVASGIGAIGSDLSGTGGVDIMPQPTLGTQTSIASGVRLPGSFEKGGSIDSEEGGVTPGEFDHNDNPIDMVQDGEKIGEATGGELILPPDDVEAVRSALQEGDKDAAFELMQDLVSKYDENVIEAEGSEAQDGGKVKGKKKADSSTKTATYDPEKSRSAQDKKLERIRKAEFDGEFAAARNAGKETFTFRGKEYTTKLKEETPKMKHGGYLERVKARMGAYMKSKY